MGNRGGGGSRFAGKVRIRRTLGNKLLSWALGITEPGFAGSGASVGEKPLHFGKQVACLSNGRHGVRSCYKDTAQLGQWCAVWEVVVSGAGSLAK